MLDTLLGKGFKTVTGALIWALAHVGLLSTLLGLAGVHSIAGQDVQTFFQSLGAALAVVGVAHKINRFDLKALVDALVAAIKQYAAATGAGS